MRKLLLALVLCFLGALQASSMYLVPLSGGDNLQHYFNRNERDDCMKALCDLKTYFLQLGYDLQAATFEDAIKHSAQTILFDMPCSFGADHDPAQWFLFLWEPPTVMLSTYQKDYHRYFSKIFTLFDTMRNENYIKFYFPQPSLVMIENIPPFAGKKLGTLIACNKSSPHPLELYSHRKQVIYYFELNAPHEFDFYGIGWNAQAFKTYKGSINTKVTYLKNYKFSFCYENMLNNGGYITEKIFDSFVAGCVPVYLGATNISAYIPSNCFIAREKFNTMEEVHKFLKNMSQEEYNGYLENIRTFLRSNEAFLFSIEFFVDLVMQNLVLGYDRTMLFTAEVVEKLIQANEIYAKRHGALT